MWVLILVVTIRGIYHTDIDVKTIPHLESNEQCVHVSNTIIKHLVKSDPSIRVDVICEKGV
jgi:hypothetical protein